MIKRKSIALSSPFGIKTISVYEGELTDFNQPVSLLTVSAFRHNYSPNRNPETQLWIFGNSVAAGSLRKFPEQIKISISSGLDVSKCLRYGAGKKSNRYL